jgi:hypothetical protein
MIVIFARHVSILRRMVRWCVTADDRATLSLPGIARRRRA